ncbi:MAG: hypothetical protein Sylvanvirus14_8 [Sylvanvirus sp.]|uniref:Uncharacterized protein n=1 Tax=Sylvanvirus sp. TaxID=2487774 RepID=A0A3G5AKS1_9VIRU|nr:MAG: hypothetical protein Sylvanvirus14_8 [Sylvanvirus sp.]
MTLFDLYSYVIMSQTQAGIQDAKKMGPGNLIAQGIRDAKESSYSGYPSESSKTGSCNTDMFVFVFKRLSFKTEKARFKVMDEKSHSVGAFRHRPVPYVQNGCIVAEHVDNKLID